MAATDHTGAKSAPVKGAAAPTSTGGAGALLAAALALPGVLPTGAIAQTTMPDAGVIALKYLDYRDWQPGANRMTVRSPSLYALKPLPDNYTIEGSLVYDAMSGASPLYFNTLSGATGMGVTDYRTAGDIKITKYMNRLAVGAAGFVSSERDYLSRAAGMDIRWTTEDNNTTFAFGMSGADDTINSTNDVAVNQKRYSLTWLVGVTQALSPTAIVQSNLTYYQGHGYYSDPYKPLDTRPNHRRTFAWLTRYNQFIPQADAALQLSYRYLHDSFGFSANMFETAWAQSMPDGWTVTPSLRYYTQGAASFYFNPPFPSGYRRGALYSADTRLAAYGAFTGSVWIQKVFADGWSADFKVAMYRQRTSWYLGGTGSPGIDPFSARWLEAGISKTF